MVFVCNGVSPNVNFYDECPHGVMVKKYFQSKDFTIIIPKVTDPWVALDESWDTFCSLPLEPSRPLLLGLCVGGLTCLHLLAEHPGVFRGAVLHNPISNPGVATARYPTAIHATSPNIGKIQDPVYIWHGDEDLISPIEESQIIATANPNIHLSTIKHGRHATLPTVFIAGLDVVLPILYPENAQT